MMDENVHALRQALEAWSTPSRRPEYFEIYAPDAEIHVHDVGRVAALHALYDAIWAAFPDAIATIDDLVAEGEKLAYRMTVTATHLGQFQDLAPTDKQISLSQIGILPFKDGKVAQRWGCDNLAEVL